MDLAEARESWPGHHSHKKKNGIKSTSILNTIILKEKGCKSSVNYKKQNPFRKSCLNKLRIPSTSNSPFETKTYNCGESYELSGSTGSAGLIKQEKTTLDFLGGGNDCGVGAQNEPDSSSVVDFMGANVK